MYYRLLHLISLSACRPSSFSLSETFFPIWSWAMGVRPAKKKRCHLPEGSYWLFFFFFFFSTGKWMTIFPTFASCRTLYRSGQWEGGRGSSPSFPSFYRQSASRGIDLCTTIYYTERERETSVSAAARETCSFPSSVTPPTNRPHLLFRGGCYFPSFPFRRKTLPSINIWAS
jgi:hypothetical protein